jgi:hypothetical protein
MAYQKLLQRSPLMVQALTTGALFAVGDVVAQRLGHHLDRLHHETNGNAREATARNKDDDTNIKSAAPSFEWRRLLAMTAFGCAVAVCRLIDRQSD